MCQGIVDLPIFFDTGSVRFVLCGGRWSCNCSGVGVSIFRSVLVISTVGLLVRSLSRICLGRRRVIVLRDWFRDRLNGSYRRDGLRRLRGLCSGGGTRSGLIRIIARKKRVKSEMRSSFELRRNHTDQRRDHLPAHPVRPWRRFGVVLIRERGAMGRPIR